jgi:phospholipase/lecithinase/hemolysin
MKIVLIAFLAFTTSCHAATFTEIVAFGDSLTDMGNRFVTPNKTEEKLRETWVKHLAGPAMLNIPTFKPSGLSAYHGGTNYAVNGATTEYAARLASEKNRGENLTQQVSMRYLNAAFNTDGVKKEALHVVVIGANDLMLASISQEQILSQWKDFDSVGVAVARSAEGQMQALVSAGAKYFLWGNVFDVSQTPSVVTKAKLVGGPQAPAYLAALAKAVIAHNTEMDSAIERLEKANPSIKIVQLDLYAIFADVAAHPAKYGFTDASTGANDPEHLFSADGLHLTTRSQMMLAKQVFGILESTDSFPK